MLSPAPDLLALLFALTTEDVVIDSVKQRESLFLKDSNESRARGVFSHCVCVVCKLGCWVKTTADCAQTSSAVAAVKPHVYPLPGLEQLEE